MKKNKAICSLADFENELETLNQSEMKELVGGTEETYTYGVAGGAFGGHNSLSSFLSSYNGASSPAIGSSQSSTSSGSSSSSSSSSGPSPQKIEECKKQYDRAVAAAERAALSPSYSYPLGNKGNSYMTMVGNAGRALANCLR